jgi:hypothetical protein
LGGQDNTEGRVGTVAVVGIERHRQDAVDAHNAAASHPMARESVQVGQPGSDLLRAAAGPERQWEQEAAASRGPQEGQLSVAAAVAIPVYGM